MPWISMLPRVAITNVSTVVIRRTAPIGARVAVRLAASRQKKVQPPGTRLKAPKTKRKTRARAEIGPSSYVQGMSLDEAQAWFKDYETLAAKSGKA